MISDNREITPNYLWRTLLTKTFKNLFLSVNIVRSKYIQNFSWYTDRKRTLGRASHRWEYIINM